MDKISLTFLGQAGIALRYQDTTIVADPHLSNFLSAGNPNSPWQRLYEAPTTLAALKPDGIIISHAHGDHLDPMTLTPYYQQGGTAPLMVPAPVAKRVTYAEPVVAARAEETMTVGNVTITPIPCAHTTLHQDANGDYAELSYFLDCGGIRVFFGGDLSLYEGLAERLAGEHIDIMILPVNGEDEERTSKGIIGNVDVWTAAKLASDCGAVLVPMHHDLYAINGCPDEDIHKAATTVRCMQLRCMQTAEFSKVQG